MLAKLRTLTLNPLMLHERHSVTAGSAVLTHDIVMLLAMAGIRLGWSTCKYHKSALGCRLRVLALVACGVSSATEPEDRSTWNIGDMKICSR
jgi:hypothetical protein